MRGPRCTSSRHALRPNRQRQEDHEIMLSMSRLEVDDDVGDVTDQLLFGDSTDDMLSVATDEAVTQTAATQLRALGRDLDVNLPIRPTCDGGSATNSGHVLQEMRASVREASSLVSHHAQDRN